MNEFAAQKQNVWKDSLDAIVSTGSGHKLDFLLRRVADKHLFLEGVILREYDKTKDCNKSVCTILAKGKKQLSANSVAEADEAN